MQASVHTFEEETGAGSVLLDDGRQVRFAADVFVRSALLRLRPGQRVSVELTDDAPGDGDSVEGDGRDGDARDGDARDGDARDGDAVDGDARDGDTVDGDARDGGPGVAVRRLWIVGIGPGETIR